MASPIKVRGAHSKVEGVLQAPQVMQVLQAGASFIQFP
jgi:hypothetical protein